MTKPARSIPWFAMLSLLGFLAVCPPAWGLTNRLTAVDFRVSKGFPKLRLKEFLLSFQGIVNRDAPRLFVIFDDDDYYWLQELQADYGLSYTNLTSPWDVFSDTNLLSRCHQVIVTDTNLTLTLNAAVTLAGVNGTACAVIQRSQDLTDITNHGFTVHTDLRGLFSSNEQVQAWIYTNYRSLTRPDVMGVSMGTTDLNKGLDYMVQQKMMHWCLDSKPVFLQDYPTTQRAILASYPPSMVYGTWTKEGADVTALSEFGHWMVVDGRNNSVFSQLPALAAQRQPVSKALPVYNPTNSYVLFSFSQGDACDFCQSWNLDNLSQTSSNFPSLRVAERYPFGLFQATCTIDYQPNVVQRMNTLKTTNQFFTGKPFGYTDPTEMDQQGRLEAWLQMAKPYLARLGYPDCMINDSSAESDPTHLVMNKICSQLKPRAVLYKHQLHPAVAEDDPPEYISGVPVFGDPVLSRDSTAPGDTDFDVGATKQAILASAGKRQFFWVFLDHTDTAGRLEQLLDSLAASNPEIVPLNPDQFVRLYLVKFPPPTNPVPALSISRSDGVTRLSWPEWAPAWNCESTPSLSTTASWTPLTNPATIAGTNFSLTLPAGGGRAFFRLAWP